MCLVKTVLIGLPDIFLVKILNLLNSNDKRWDFDQLSEEISFRKYVLSTLEPTCLAPLRLVYQLGAFPQHTLLAQTHRPILNGWWGLPIVDFFSLIKQR